MSLYRKRNHERFTAKRVALIEGPINGGPHIRYRYELHFRITFDDGTSEIEGSDYINGHTKIAEGWWKVTLVQDSPKECRFWRDPDSFGEEFQEVTS